MRREAFAVRTYDRRAIVLGLLVGVITSSFVATVVLLHDMWTPKSGLDVSPAAPTTFDDIVVNKTSTLTGLATIKDQKWPQALDGTLAFETQLNDWNPAGLATNTVILVQASDNVGSLVTGIDAIDNGFTAGTIRVICNGNGPVDDGNIVLSNEDSSSLANNRIWTPSWGHSSAPSAEDRFTIGPSDCRMLVYEAPDQTMPAQLRWVVAGGNERIYRSVIEQLQLFPLLTPDPTTVTGTINNWNPVDTCPALGGPHGGSCEAGSSTAFADYTALFVTTNDGTGVVFNGWTVDTRTKPSGLGQLKLLINNGPGPITLVHQAGAQCAGCQFTLPNNTNVIINPGEIRWVYNDLSFWRVTSYLAGNGLSTNSVPVMQNANTFKNSVITDDGTTLTLIAGKLSVTEATGDVTMTGKQIINFARDGDPIAITNTAAGRTIGTVHDINIVDNGSFNTTAGPKTLFGIASTVTCSKSAGANTLTCFGGDFQASGGDLNIALATGPGDVDLGSTVTVTGTNTLEVGGQTFVDSTLNVFSGVMREKASPSVPAANHGTLSGDATNFIGHITAIGANTSVTLTFGGGGFATTSHCFTEVESAGVGIGEIIYVSTVSKTAPVFTCVDSTTGNPANCPDFSYMCWGN